MGAYMLDFITEKQNSWDYLASCNLPVFIYGMGDGALKIMSVMDEYKIPVSGIFASDEYVRGHFFAGHKVHKLSEIEENLTEFIIVLAFAASYQSLVDTITELAARHILLAPDVPVAGNGLFTYEYCVENSEKIEKVYSLLEDEKSKEVFKNIINFKISGKIEYLNDITTPKAEIYQNIIKLTENETYVDLGAYNGDTVLEFLQETNYKFDKIIALEPDKKNFKKLQKNTEGVLNIETYNSAVWEFDTTLTFSNKAGRQSSLSASGIDTDARSVDSIMGSKPCTLIKMDVEGAEKQAIMGAKFSISNFSPKLMISLYHRNEDLFELPLLINETNPNYKLFLRHQLYIPAWETNLYATI